MEIVKRIEKQMKTRPAFASQWALPVAALAIGMVALGCSSTMEDPSKLVTIDQGVFGSTTTYDDVGDGEAEPWEADLSVYDADPGPDAGSAPAATLVGSAHSDEGFFEIRLDPGNYVLCTSFRR